MIHLDPTSPVPIYEQISEQFRRLIALGALAPGDRLPTVRELAARVRVNRNTAARAIQQLEAAGIVRTHVGKGTFVEPNAPRLDSARRESILDGLIDKLLVEAHTLGTPLDQLAARLSERIEEFLRQSKSGETGDDGSGSDDVA